MLRTSGDTAPLASWARDFHTRTGRTVPQFDPAEGGVTSRALLLLEAPGPMTNSGNTRPGSGFISVDNDDATAEAVWRGRAAAGLTSGVLAWNIVPWYLGSASVKPTSSEVAEGASALLAVLDLLPALEVVILAGRFAQRGWCRHVSDHVDPRLTVVEVWHPSSLSLNQPGKRADFDARLREVALHLAERSTSHR